MQSDDSQFFKHGDVFYIALEGESFNYCAILDDYDVQQCIGTGGFGKVHLAISKETKKKYALKFMDISSACKSNPSSAPLTLNRFFICILQCTMQTR